MSPVADRLVEGASDCRREWDEDGLAAFAEDAEDAEAVFLAESVVSRPVASKIRSPSNPSRHTSEVIPVGRELRRGQQRFEL